MKLIDGKTYLDTNDVAEKLAVSQGYARYLGQQNKIKHILLRGKRFYDPAEVERFANAPRSVEHLFKQGQANGRPKPKHTRQTTGSVLD